MNRAPRVSLPSRFPGLAWALGGVLALGAAGAGCSLLSLDDLHDGSGGAASTSTATGPTGTTTTTTVTAVSGSSVSTSTHASSSVTTTDGATSSAASTSTGGCTAPFFCDDHAAAPACGDFDSAGHGIDEAWLRYISPGGAGTISSITDAFVSCPSAARIDFSGVPDSTAQLHHSVAVIPPSKLTVSGKVLRSGPGGVSPEGAGALELEYLNGAPNPRCQSYVQMFDMPSPHFYFFNQLAYDDGSHTTLAEVQLELASPSTGAWTDVGLVFDFGASMITVSSGSASTSVALPSGCSAPSTSVDVSWGPSYASAQQTMELDNLLLEIQ